MDKLGNFLMRTIGLSLFLAIAMVRPAPAWETGVAYDMPLDPCNGAPLNGAATLVIRVTPHNDGSFGLPVLVGLKDGESGMDHKLAKG